MADIEPLIVTEGTRQAVVDDEGLVVNVIIAPDDFDPGDGCTLVPVPGDSPAEPGDRFVAGSLTKTERPPRPPTLEERVAALEEQSRA